MDSRFYTEDCESPAPLYFPNKSRFSKRDEVREELAGCTVTCTPLDARE